MGLTDKQKKILALLEKEGEIATSKIAFLITVSLYQAEVYLEDLYERGLIVFNKKNNATYWRLKPKENGI